MYVVFGLNELMAYIWRIRRRLRLIGGGISMSGFRRWAGRRGRGRSAGVNGGRYPHDVVVLDYDEFSISWGLMPRGRARGGGQASMQFVVDAIGAWPRRKIDAVVTAPICEESWKLAGFDR